ncbi:MAG: YihA family ribosome biogenesis GTP-binding protein [Rhodospirillaceae bacterium]|nr:YihA family ribosome biogenesis GTP-binding protein [Rhodospirillaceae bacterium]
MSGKRKCPASETMDAALLERGRNLFAQDCNFIHGAMQFDQLPAPVLPELAFAGRSNVGKSSLVNALTGQKTLARISNTPGRTQQINFFDLGQRLMLVDLPGYGYARASKKSIAEWTHLIHLYLKGRVNLRRICLLIDSRHGLKDNDRALMTELDHDAVVFQIVLTKSDKPKVVELEKTVAAITAELKKHPAAMPDVHVTSSFKKLGIEQLRADLVQLATNKPLR